MILVSLTACAPEPGPGNEKSQDATGLTPNSIGHWDEGHQLDGEKTDSSEGSGSHLGGREPVEVEKSHDLPATFPLEAVPIPPDSIIDDAGERSETEWFVVVRTTSLAAANEVVRSITQAGDFTLESEEVNDDGGLSQEFVSERARISSLTFLDGSTGFANLEVKLLG